MISLYLIIFLLILVAVSFYNPALLKSFGGVAEWLKAHAWKVCMR